MIKRIEYVDNKTSARFIIEIDKVEYGFAVSKQALQEIIENMIPDEDFVCMSCQPTDWKPEKVDKH